MLQYPFVVVGYDGFDIGAATITQLHGVTVEYLVVSVRWREMLVEEVQVIPPDVAFYGHIVRWVEPDYIAFSSPVVLRGLSKFKVHVVATLP